MTSPTVSRDWEGAVRDLLGGARLDRRQRLPGREPLWRLLSSLKRGLGFRPRRT